MFRRLIIVLALASTPATSLERKAGLTSTRTWERVEGPPVPAKVTEPEVKCVNDDDCGKGRGKCEPDVSANKICKCEKEYATLPSGANATVTVTSAGKACAYDRKSRTTAIILHVLIGGFGAGAFCESAVRPTWCRRTVCRGR